MGRLAIVALPLLASLAGCRAILGIDSPARGDGSVVTPDTPGGSSDAPAITTDASCAPIDGFSPCMFPLTGLPTGPVIDTSVCTGGTTDGHACVFHVAGPLVIDNLQATGLLALVIASDGDLTIGGTVDVGSHTGGQRGPNADGPACSLGPLPASGSTTGGGGAGGSYATTGGNGGAGGNDNSATGGVASGQVTAPTDVSGGCDGQPGAHSGNLGLAGAGGGAIWLVAAGAMSVGPSGVIAASGAGGTRGDAGGGGAGGGGAGGMIRLSSAVAITNLGALFAIGGGGGGGGSSGSPGDSDGDNGEPDGSAVGGVPSGNAGGGGTGGGTSPLPGGDGTSAIPGSNGGGGGGGGGAGFIQLHAPTVTNSGGTTPPAS